MRTSAGQRIRWFALATALAGMVIALTPVAASAGLHSPIPADALGDPNDVFTDDQPLFAYALSDIRGGEICIVSATVQDASGLSCGGLNWGGKNSVVGIGTQFLPVASPPLRIGTWKLMTTDSEGNNAELSDVFSVIPCETSCSSALANDILQGYKQAAHTNLIGAATACLTFAAMELKGGDREGARPGRGPHQRGQGLHHRCRVYGGPRGRHGVRVDLPRHPRLQQPG